jgi:hypothetical protein
MADNVDFPNNPAIGEIFSIEDRSWQWNGTVWNAVDLKQKLEVYSTDELTIPGVLFVGADEPEAGSYGEGDLWTDLDDDAGSTEFIYSGPEEPENYDVDTLWIDTDEPELPLIYADDEPPEYTNVEGDFWVDLDDTFGTQFVQSEEEPNPDEAEFWVDLGSVEGFADYKSFFENGAAQYSQISQLPTPAMYPGMLAYVSNIKSLYLSSNGAWEKIYPVNDAETLVWMGL